jgi:hypothetical protein
MAELYEIQIKGHLSDYRVGEFQGMRVVLIPDGTTRISGPVADQAALHGILIRIRDLNIPLLSVQRIKDPND